MERHDFIVGTLIRTGFRAGLRGFDQFCMCVEVYSDDRTATIESVYHRVAERFNCTKSSIEKNLTRLFKSSDGAIALAALFDTKPIDAGNKEMVALFSNFVELNRAEYTM